jgi:hypothetical protein
MSFRRPGALCMFVRRGVRRGGLRPFFSVRPFSSSRWHPAGVFDFGVRLLAIHCCHLRFLHPDSAGPRPIRRGSNEESACALALIFFTSIPIAPRPPQCYIPLRCAMNKSELIASATTVLIVLGLVAFRLLWAGSQAAAGSALGSLPMLPKTWRRWLLGEHGAPPAR